MKKSEVEFLKKKLKSRKSKKSLFQEMPKLASVKIDESEIVKKYVSLNVSILSKVPLSRVYKMILFSKTGNKIKSNKEFKKIKNLNQRLVKYTLHDLCFSHFELCGLIRSAIFKNDLNQEQVIWFNDNIRSSIWELKNSFQVENFRLELGQGNKSIIKKIQELSLIYNLDIDVSKEFLGVSAIRKFLRKKLKSNHRSILDIYNLFLIGDRDYEYFKFLGRQGNE